MKLQCQKYMEEFDSEDAFCRHPGEYCKFRGSCMIEFIAREKKGARRKQGGAVRPECSGQ